MDVLTDPRRYVKSYGVLQTRRDKETAHLYVIRAEVSYRRWAEWPAEQERRLHPPRSLFTLQALQGVSMDKWLHLIELIAEPILAVSGVPIALIPLVRAGIQEAETIHGNDTGTSKLQHVINLVSIGANAANAAAGKTVIDATALTSTVTQGINTTIAAVNLVHGATPVALPPTV